MESPAADRLARISIFATLLLSYGYFFSGSGFNQNSTFDLTRAIVEQRVLFIDRYASNTSDVSMHAGHIYSNKAPALAFVAAVPYSMLVAIHGAPRSALELNLDLYFSTVFACGIPGALIGVLLYRAARHRGAPAVDAHAVAIIGGLGTPLFAYSTMLFAHVPSALCVLAAFLLLDGTLRRSPALAGFAAGLATIINYAGAPLAGILLIFAVATSKRRLRDAILFAAGGAPFALLFAWYNVLAFGSPLTTSIAAMNPAFSERGAWLGILRLPRLDALWGITFSPYRGLFIIAPVLLLCAAGIFILRDRASSWTIAAATATLLIFNAGFNGWHGGYTIGPRYLIPIVPLLLIALAPAMARWRKLVIVAAAVSLFVNLAATAVDPQPPDRLRDPLGHYSIPSLLTGKAIADPNVPWIEPFYTGHTSTNRVAADEPLPFRLHPPGSPESEWASFNLGEIAFGAGAAASLVPWLSIVAALIIMTRQAIGYRGVEIVDAGGSHL